MPDTREEILARLVAIGSQVPGVTAAGRNRVALSETARPAIIVLDADEAAEEEEPRGRPGTAPQLVVMTPELFVLAGKPAAGIGAEPAKPLLDHRGIHDFTQRRVELRDEGARRSGRRQDTEKSACFVIRNARFGKGRHIGQRRRTRIARHRQRLYGAGIDRPLGRRQPGKEDIDVAADHVRDRLPATTIRHMGDLEIIHPVEPCAHDVRRRTDAAGRGGL